MRTLPFLSISVLLLIGCKKDCVTPQPCTPLPNPASPFGWGAVYSFGYFHQPCFNPNDPNEIVFKQGVYDSEESPRICTFNLTTLEKRTIFTNNTFSPPDWGANGKIIFTRPDYNIWQINPDGSGLEQLTNQGWRHGANWSKDGTKFIAGTQDDGHYFRIIHSANGSIIDTTVVSDGCWRHDSLICYRGKVSNPYTEVSDIIVPFDGSLGLGACWLNDREFIWSTEKGIFITDRILRKSDVIKSSCNAISYQSPTYHPVSNKVVWQKVVKEPMAGASSSQAGWSS